MNLKNLMKKMAVLGLGLAVAFSTVAYLPTAGSVAEASGESFRLEHSSMDLSDTSTTIASYTGGDTQSGDYYIVIADRSRTSEISTATLSAFDSLSGCYYKKVVMPTQSGTIKLSDTSIRQSGDYGVYYFNDSTGGSVYKEWFTVTDDGSSSSSSSSSSGTTKNGPQISRRSFNIYGYGFDATFKVTNESVSYEWYVYDKTPNNRNKTEIDSGSGTTSEKNEEIFFTTNNLSQDSTYYLVFKVTGDNTRKTNYYTSDGTSSSSNSYYRFKTKNSDTYATGTSSSNTSAKETKNADGTVTKTSTATKDGIKSTTKETSGYPDGHKTTNVQSTPTSNSATWKSSEINATLYSDGSAVQTMVTLMKDGTKVMKEASTTSIGTTTIVSSEYNTAGGITSLSTEVDNSSNAVIQSISYDLGGGNFVTVKKITASRATVTIPDSVIANGVDYEVTAVADNAFKGNTKVTKLVLGDSISKVGKNAFKSNKNLKTILIKSPLDSVGTNAFKGTNKNAVIKIDAGASAYKSTVKLIKKAGVGSKVKFKRV